MPNVAYGLTPVGIASGGIWSNAGAPTTIIAGNLPGQALPPVFDVEWNEETVTTEMVGYNAVQGVISVVKKAHVKMTLDAKIQPEVMAILKGYTLTVNTTVSWVIKSKAGQIMPTFAFDVAGLNPDSVSDRHYGAYGCIVTKLPPQKSEAYKPGTKMSLEFDVFADAAGFLIYDAAHSAAVAVDVTGQPKLP